MLTTRKLVVGAALLSVFATIASGGVIARQEAARQPVTPEGRAAHRPTVAGVHGLVTAGHSLASMSGLRMLMKGGNAADAAVAILATLNQVEPMMSGAGGNGFMTIYDKATDHVYSLNATGAAPLALDPEEVTPEELSRGMKAGVVPGLFGGWIALLDRFGTLSLAEVLEPAIDYAENGHPLDPYVTDAIAQRQSLFEQFPTTASVFLPGKGCYRCLFPTPPPPGEVPSCAEAGVLGMLPGWVSTIQATETVKLIMNIGTSLSGRLLLIDALDMDFRTVKLRRNPECPLCGDNPTVTELIDYEAFCGAPVAAD